MPGSKTHAGLKYVSQGHQLEDPGAAVSTRYSPTPGLEYTWGAGEFQVAQ